MSESPYSKENVRKGILHYLLGRGMAGAAGFAIVILLVRYMDVRDYAGYTALTGLIVLSGIIAGLGLDRAISRYVPEGRLHHSADELRRFIWITSLIRLVAALAVCLVIAALWDRVIQVFDDVDLPRLPPSFICFIVAETLFQHLSSVLQALLLQQTLTRIMVVQWAGRLALIFMIVNSQAQIRLIDALRIMAVPEMLGVLCFIVVVHRYLRELAAHAPAVEKAQGTWPDWRIVAQVATHNYGFTLLAAPPQGYFMKMLAAAFLPTHMVAAYGFFISIAEKVRQYIPLHLFYNLIEPVMIAGYLQDRDFRSLSHRCQLLYKSNLLLLVPAMGWVAAAGPAIIATMTGGKFQEYAWLLLVVMLQLTIGSHVVLLQLILNSVEKSALLVRASIVALVGMAAFFVLVLGFDATWLVGGPIVFSLITNTYIIHRIAGLGHAYKPSWRLIWGLLLAGGAAYGVTSAGLALMPRIPSAMALALIAGVGVLAGYLLSLWLLKAIEESEVQLVKSLLFRKRQKA